MTNANNHTKEPTVTSLTISAPLTPVVIHVGEIVAKGVHGGFTAEVQMTPVVAQRLHFKGRATWRRIARYAHKDTLMLAVKAWLEKNLPNSIATIHDFTGPL